MAKELPYFKFEPSEWLEGEIQVCSDESIVCFINLCSGYWLKLGNINYAFALHKYCKKDASVLQELIDNKIITLNNDEISISFLDKQLNEFKEISEKRTSAANKRWENKEENASALQVLSKSNAIREDKKIKDNTKEDKDINPNLSVDWEKLKNNFNELTGKKTKVVSTKVKGQINARLKEGYTKQDLWNAIVNCFNDPYHKENPKYLTLEFISRSAFSSISSARLFVLNGFI